MKTSFLPLCVAMLAVAPEAAAQTGSRMRVSVERVFGFAYNSLTSASERLVGSALVTTEVTNTWTSISLFGAGFSAGGTVVAGLLPATQVPRFAFDYEITPNLTLGAAAFFAWNSFTDADGDGLSSVGVGLAPRVGYSISLSDRLAFWPRAGLTLAYVSASPVRGTSSATTTTTSSSSYLPVWVNVEPTLVYAVDPHFLFTFALLLDIPVAGGVTSTTTTTAGGTTVERTSEGSFKQLTFAAQFGVMGRF